MEDKAKRFEEERERGCRLVQKQVDNFVFGINLESVLSSQIAKNQKFLPNMHDTNHGQEWQEQMREGFFMVVVVVVVVVGCMDGFT